MGNITSRYDILVVDDEELVCSVIKQKLNEDNFYVKMASNGTEAIESVKTKNPCLIILDVNLPDKNGLAVLKEIKTVSSEVPVVMISGSYDKDDEALANKLGASEYLTKPIDWNYLRNMAYLCSFLDEKKLDLTRRD